MAERIVVLAGDRAQFRQWARAAGLDPHDRHLTYARDVYTLQGIHGARIVRYGTWHLRPDARELDARARMAEAPGVVVPAT
ncbi:hypothetical protein ACFUT3_30405 [Streptomyces cinereoruber]|uniref:hypothetical protein n=1 Tax=Streptomyces cinereoruber TaxID=67260 RepID=UPI00362F8F8F